MLVVATGRATEFGVVAAKLGGRKARTRYESGLSAFGVLLVRVMIVLLAAMFVVNLALHRAAIDSLLFSLALAVGITPQLLPAIETISLSTGAREMAREKVIVKRLDAIEDFGAMTVLCTDKTGTLTTGSARSRMPWTSTAARAPRSAIWLGAGPGGTSGPTVGGVGVTGPQTGGSPASPARAAPNT